MPLNTAIAQLDQVEIAYYENDAPSTAEVVLLIHGFASTAQVNWLGTGWFKLLSEAGYRVIAFDNRGHGNSSKFYSPDDYGPDIFAADALGLLDQLQIESCHIIGYSMGTRIASWICHAAPGRVNQAVFGGMGDKIFGQGRDYEGIAQALETDNPEEIEDRSALAFRRFADATGSDRRALAACIRPAKRKITPEIIKSIITPTLVVVGSEDDVGGSAVGLASMMQNAESLVLDGLDHMKSTGAAGFKQGALDFFDRGSA